MIDENIPKLIEYEITKADFSEKEEVYIVKLLSDNTFIKINKKTKELLSEIDGFRSYKDISLSINEKYKINSSEEYIKDLILNKLGKNGLLEGFCDKEQKKLPSRLWFHWNLLDGKIFENIAKKLTFLFHPTVVILSIIIAVLLIASILGEISLISLLQKRSMNYLKSSSLLIILILMLLTSAFHELGHIVASFRFGARPRNVGVGLYLLMPVFFVDLSESWTLDRKKRCIIDLGGIYFQIVATLIYSPMIFMNTTLFNITTYKLIVYAMITNILFNLNPSLKMDGYWALSDFTGIVNIHNRTNTKIKNTIKRILGKKNIDNNYSLSNNVGKVFFIWSIIYTAVTGLFIYIAVGKLMKMIQSGVLNFWLIILFIIAYLGFRFLTAFLKGKFDR